MSFSLERDAWPVFLLVVDMGEEFKGKEFKPKRSTETPFASRLWEGKEEWTRVLAHWDAEIERVQAKAKAEKAKALEEAKRVQAEAKKARDEAKKARDEARIAEYLKAKAARAKRDKPLVAAERVRYAEWSKARAEAERAKKAAAEASKPKVSRQLRLCKVRCPTCGGTGRIRYRYRPSRSTPQPHHMQPGEYRGGSGILGGGATRPQYRWRTCRTCRGKGSVSKWYYFWVKEGG